MDEEKLTAIIGIRFLPSWKKQIQEEAKARGETLSDYIYEIIEAGLKKMTQEDVKQGSEKC